MPAVVCRATVEVCGEYYEHVFPYFEQPTLPLGPLTLHAFGLVVAIAVLVGVEVGRRRLKRARVSAAVADDLPMYVVVGGILGAHWFSLLFYFPEQLETDPLSLLRVWEDLSSFGAMLGGLVGVGWFLRRRQRALSSRDRWVIVDVVVYAFAVALMVGRIACTLAHDHPGTITDFPLAISLSSEDARAYIGAVYAAAGRLPELPASSELAQLGFHDLGWYEFLYLALIATPVMVMVGRRVRPAGTFFLLFVALYMPARFLFDFLRVSDAHYAGLTPAQWAALGFIALAPIIWRRSAAARR